MHTPIYLFIYLFGCLSAYLGICLSLSVCLAVYLSLSVYLAFYLSLSVCLAVHLSLSIWISIYLSVYLAIYIYLYLFPCVSIYLYIHFLNISISVCKSIYSSIYCIWKDRFDSKNVYMTILLKIHILIKLMFHAMYSQARIRKQTQSLKVHVALKTKSKTQPWFIRRTEIRLFEDNALSKRWYSELNSCIKLPSRIFFPFNGHGFYFRSWIIS